ncbi:hypothetical protein [Kocuria rosea]|jgi:hypothetical protein|uniref:hypothetical protein n=1 Tax=Kocuria rosea TaxID=1275 RepID=UPI00203DE598|nr:hypothetical protein [Kocuria rosea]HST73595.1 hypothetical protein [Kocuria rosea]
MRSQDDNGEETTVRDETPDDGEGSARARVLCRAVRRAGIAPREVWFRSFTLGSEVGELEVDAYLHGCLRLPPSDQELLTRAIAQLLGGRPPHGGGPRPSDRC